MNKDRELAITAIIRLPVLDNITTKQLIELAEDAYYEILGDIQELIESNIKNRLVNYISYSGCEVEHHQTDIIE